MSIKTLARVRIFLLGSWVITALTIFFLLLVEKHLHDLRFETTRDAITRIFGLIIPQIVAMTAILFSTKPETTNETIPKWMLPLIISSTVLYHLLLIFCLIYGVMLENFSEVFPESVDGLLIFMGYFAVLGTTPVAFLFRTNNSAEPKVTEKKRRPSRA